jgi:hypothetical protein
MRKLFPLRKRLFSLPIVLCLASGLTSLAAITPIEPFSTAASAQEVKLKIRGSGLPVPRFVTLKFNQVNMRAGPGREYPVLWAYTKTGLPLMVEAEFGAWRKVVDHEGTTGWMRGSVLSLRRMALVTEGRQEYIARQILKARSLLSPKSMRYWSCNPARQACAKSSVTESRAGLTGPPFGASLSLKSSINAV